MCARVFVAEPRCRHDYRPAFEITLLYPTRETREREAESESERGTKEIGYNRKRESPTAGHVRAVKFSRFAEYQRPAIFVRRDGRVREEGKRNRRRKRTPRIDIWLQMRSRCRERLRLLKTSRSPCLSYQHTVQCSLTECQPLNAGPSSSILNSTVVSTRHLSRGQRAAFCLPSRSKNRAIKYS